MDKKLSVLWALCGVILLFPQATSSATCEKTVADIAFLLDDSGSVKKHNFLKVKEFVIGIVRSLRIGSDQVRVATVSFSSSPVINFQLNGYNDKKKLIDAIKNIKYRKGGTNTHLGLEMLNSVFTKGNGDRTGVPNIAIVITDGISKDKKLTIQKAEALQKAGVVMFSIGIGKRLRQSELIAMASKPTSEHKFTVDNFDALQGITKKITTKTCEEKACYCSGYGDPHYKTFDGQMIHFMGICKYTLAASTKGAPYFFAIEVKNEHRGNTRVSYTRMVDVKLKGVTIRLLPGNKMLVNGERRSFPIRGVMGFWARYSCGWITVSTSWGLKVQFDGRHRVRVKVRGGFANKLTGICGDCNGKKDDFRTKQGKDVSKNSNKYSLIGSSYKVKDDSGRPTPKCDVPDVKIDCKPQETRRCNVIKHRIFKKCIAKLGMEKFGEYLESCQIDACVYRKNKKLFQNVLCSAIEEYAGECAKAGVPVAWRRVAKCPKRCPPRQVYKFATPICQPSCTTRNPKCRELIEGCVCRKGYLLSGKKCVPKSKCGCFYKGFYMEANEDIIDPKCQRKTICKAGGKVVTATLAPCQPNGICRLYKGKRVCVCKRGFYFHNGKCTPKVCEKTVADIVFLLDESGSVTRKNFVKVKQFVMNIVRSLKIGSNRVRVGVVSFSSKTSIRFHLKRYFDQKRMINAIRNIRYVGGGTNTHIALRRLRLSAFTKRNGDRIGVPNIAIVITDGKSSKERATKLEASRLQKAGVIMFSIGIGKNLRPSELIAMASKPISEHKFTVASFAALKSIANEITTKTCEDSCISKGCRNGGICTRIAKTGKCICKAGFVGKYCQHQKACYCSGYGDPHYKTFDGQMIHFQGICKYTLAASTKGAPYFFAIEVKNEHRGNTRVSYTRMVDVKLKGVTIRLLPGNKMLVNGERRSFPIRGVMGFWARYSCGWITVSTSWGLKVQFDGRHRVRVKVRGGFANKLTGICGDCNGKKDDFRTKQGKDVSKNRNKYSLIGSSYKVKDDSGRPTPKCDVPDVKIDCKPQETRRCNVIKHRIFKKCIAKLGMEKLGEYLESCQIDACVYRKNKKLFQKVLCSAIEEYAGECAKAGVPVAWRRVAKCPKRCPPRQVYKFATPICQPSCTKRNPKCKELIEGCVCRKGYLLSGKKCVPKSKCGCFYKGFYMEANEDIIDPKCQRKTICKAGGKVVTVSLAPCQPNGICRLQKGKRICVCKRGFYFHNGKCTPKDSCISKECRNGGICTRIAKRWKCICKAGFVGKYCQHQKDCYCSGYGDPHYKTFDGQMIHFQGICKYTLAASTKGAPYFFAVEVKNEHRGNTRVSYTRMVDVKLKGVTIRLLPGNKMLVNGEKRSFPIRGVWGFWASYSSGWITVSTSWGLKVQFDGRHRVRVKVRGRFANKLTGICGDCNGKKDDFRTKQGKDVSKYRKKYSLIGNSYKVKDDSDRPTTKCDVPYVRIDCKPHETRRCNVIKHKIFKKCLAKLGMKKVGEYLESCRIDACVYRKNIKLFKNVLCSAIEGYAGECAKAGVPVAWRRVAKCPKRCPPRQVYKFATPICQPSCTKRNPKCKELIEGCVCRRGYLLSGKKCVPKSKCGCFYKGFYMEANENIIDPKCQRKTICKAGGKVITETLAPCQPNGICRLQKGKRICVCKRGFYFHNGKCTPKVCEKTVADIVFLLDESGSVTRKNFVKVKQFVMNIVRSLKIGSNRVRVGVVSFSSKTTIRFHLKRYFDQKRMINAIRNIRYGGGGTNTHIALTRLRLSAFTKRNGDRAGVPNIAIVITDGKSSKARATKLEASRLQKAGVIMFSIGIGKKLRQSELRAMASKPISEHKFTVDSFAALKSIANVITTKTCEDSCISKGCRNGGICTRIAKRGKCICKAGFVGKYCQLQKACYCSGYGDPHYKTFDGQMIHFQGICKYTLAASTKGAPYFFAVEVKNEHRGNTRVSYTRMVDVKLKGVTIRLLPGNKMLVNGEKRSFPIRGVWGFWARYSCGWITVSTSWGLKVQFDGRHRVRVKVRGGFANKLTGICGDCNGKKDDFRTKQGKDVSKYRNKYSLIGTSYKVKDDSDKPTTKCDVPDVKIDCKPHETRSCNVIKHRIFKKCRAKLGMKKVGEYLESCRIDACVYRKNIKLFQIVLCSAIEGYAGECAKAGVPVAWRRVAKCPKRCPPRQVYKFATPICQPSCTKRNPKCKELIEGCVCRRGYLLSGKKCVPKSKCGCFYKGFYMEANEDIIDPKCQRKTICKAGGKVITETLAPCQPNGICRLYKGKRVCVCKRGFYFHNGKCTPKVCEKTVADIVFLLDESGSVTRKNFVKVKQFVMNIVRSLKIGSNRVRVGVVSFSSKTTIRFHLKRYFDQKRMINAIRNIRYGGGGTNTHIALTRLRLSAFTKRYGDRVGVPNIAIVITDGKSSNARATKLEASRLQKAGVIMFSIGIGKKLRQSELIAMASKPISEHKFTVNSFAALKSIANEITTKTCEDSCISKGCRNGGICTRIAKRGKCICKAGFVGKYCQHQKACYCSGYGDPHYKTFDGQMIHFQGICKYTLAASTKGAPYFFAVEVKNEHRGNHRVSYTRMVDVKLKGVTIRLLPGNKMLVNGEKRSFPIRGVWGFWARYSCGWITVSTSWGLKVQFDGRHRVRVKVRGGFANKLTGICGDCNGKKDDFRTKQGKDVSKYRKKYSLIGNSYKVKDDSDRPTTKCDVPDVKFDCKPHETRSCNVIKHRIFKKCRAKLGMKKVGEYLESCRIDACVYRKNIKLFKKVLCSAIEGYAGECAKAGVPVAWRRVAKCPKRCPPRQVYKFATPICQPSCTKRNPKCKELIEGCVCRRGYLLSGKKCVPKSKCGCFYKGFYMEANDDNIDSKCQRKTICKAGGKVVTEMLAPCQPNGICRLQNGKRVCVCKREFYFHNGKCTPKVCEKTVADIVFLLDESGSVTRKNFVKVKQFVIDVVRSLKIGSNRVRVGVVSFSSKTTIRFHLKRYFDQKRMINAIRNIRYGGGGTNTHIALTRLRLSAFTKIYGDRVGVPNIAIVITDGKSSNARATKLEASRLQKAGVIMFSIGIGKKLRQSELIAMASKPISEHKFTVDSFAALKSIANEITTKTCEEIINKLEKH